MSSQPRILIVHPEPSSLTLLSSMLRSLGHVIEEAPNDRYAVKLLERGGIDMVLAGVDPQDPDAMELLSYLRRKHRQVPVILLFPIPHPERTKEALRLGALAVLRYPVPATELRAAVTQALGSIPRPANEIHNGGTSGFYAPQPTNGHEPAAAMMPRQPQAASMGHSNGNPFQAVPHGQVAPQGQHVGPTVTRGDYQARDFGMIGTDASLRQAIELAGTIAPSQSPVLILGDNGTGKSLLARTIHGLSNRSDRPYVVIDCASLSESSGEREFSFNGLGHGGAPQVDPATAWSNKLGQAQGGTIFLNEVSGLSDNLQLSLLRAIQDREYDHPSGLPMSSDIRFLISTSESLAELVEEGKFRQDLYHRISVICLKLPPLKNRGTDIEQLADYFRAKFTLEFGKNVVGFTRDALDILNKHDWPGNVRELEGVIQRGVALCQGTRITSGHLSPSLNHPRSTRQPSLSSRSQSPVSIRPLKEALEEPEKKIIIQALQALNWNRQETARVLDINRTTLYKKMKKYGLLVDEPIWVN